MFTWVFFNQDVGFAGQQKIWMDLRVPLRNKCRRDWSLVLFSHDRSGGSYRRINRVEKGKTCRGKEGLLLMSLFIKNSERPNFQLEKIWFGSLGHRLTVKRFDGGPITGCRENIVREIHGDTIEEPILEGMFQVSAT